MPVPIQIVITSKQQEAIAGITALTAAVDNLTRRMDQSNATSTRTYTAAASGIKTLGNVNKSTTATFQALEHVVTLVGFQTFPGLTSTVLTTSSTLKAVNAAAVATGASLSAISITVVGVAAAVLTGAAAWQAYSAAQQEAASAASLRSQQGDLALRLLGRIQNAVDAGKLDQSQGDRLADLLLTPTYERIRIVQRALRDLFPSSDQIKTLDGLMKSADEMRANSLDGFERERADAKARYDERIKQIDSELAAFKNFEQLRSALIDAGRQKELDGITSVAEYRKKLAGDADAEFQLTMEKASAQRAEKEKSVQAAIAQEQQRINKHIEAAWSDATLSRSQQLDLQEKAEMTQADNLLGLVEEVEAQKQRIRETYAAKRKALAEEELKAERQAAADSVRNDWRLTDAQKFSQLQSQGISGNELGADPQSYEDQWTSAIVNIRNQLGTTAQIVGQTFTSAVGGAINSISSGITGLITYTTTWRQALSNVATTILNEVIGGIVKMFVAWAIGDSAKSAVVKANATSEAVAKAPRRHAHVNIELWHCGGCWRCRSHRGSGSGWQLQGRRLHRQRLAKRRRGHCSWPRVVFDAAATARIGVPALEAMRVGAAFTPSMDAFPKSSGSDRGRNARESQQPERTIILVDKQQLADDLLRDSFFINKLVDLTRKQS